MQATDLRADRHRPRREDDVGRRADAPRSCTGPRSTTCSVRGFPKVTGQRGIQIWVPDRARTDLRRHARPGSRRCRASSVTPCPDLVSWKWEKRERGGLARLDYTQNAINKTLVAPYSVRPAPGAPVSMPITWDELDDPDLRSDRWNIRDAGARVARGRRPVRRCPDDAAAAAAAFLIPLRRVGPGEVAVRVLRRHRDVRAPCTCSRACPRGRGPC